MKMSESFANDLCSVLVDVLEGGHIEILNYQNEVLSSAKLASPPFKPPEMGRMELNQPTNTSRYGSSNDHPYRAWLFDKDGKVRLTATAGDKNDLLVQELYVDSLDPLVVRAHFSIHHDVVADKS